jgi:hypothetical protein
MTERHYSGRFETIAITLRLYKLRSIGYRTGKDHVILWSKHRHEG